MKKITYIEKDEHNAIVVCRDHFNGVVVQVVRFVDQIQPSGPDNLLTNVRTNHVVKSFEVRLKEQETFKDEVQSAIKKAKEYLGEIRRKDQSIDGVLNDLYSQHKALNDNKE